MSKTSKVAFFGATGGCAVSALSHCLSSRNYICTALARTPSKLQALLTSRHVPDSSISSLKIVPGSISDVEAVKNALIVDGNVVDTIVCGIGGKPKLQMSLLQPVTLDDAQICTSAVRSILQALTDLRSERSDAGQGPLLVFISTTGVAITRRDVPILYLPLYHYFLAVPHADKRNAETLLREEVQKEENKLIRGFVSVRPTLLTDGLSRGLENVRWGGEEEPAIGYTISREDVGNWIWEMCLERSPEDFLDKGVTLAY